MPKCNINKTALQLYWNHTSAWLFSCDFAAYFQNTFSSEHPWRAVSVSSQKILILGDYLFGCPNFGRAEVATGSVL